MPWNSSFDEVIATTLQNYEARLTDNITSQNVILSTLDRLGFIREQEGGRSIVEPLLTGESSAITSYADYDVLDNTPQTGISAAEYNWKQYAGSVSISGIEEFKNSANRKTEVVNLLRAKITQLEKSIILYLNEKLLGDGTGNNSKDVQGLAIAVEEGTAWSTYGGIDSNTNTGWRNKWTGAVGSFAANGITKMRTMFNNCTRGKDKPKLILCGQAVFEAYEKTLTSMLRITNTDMNDAGFPNLEYKGQPLVWDADMETSYAGYMYFLDPDYMRFVYGKGRKFSMSSWQKPDNQDAKVAQYIAYGNMTLNNRSLQGVLTAITTP